MYTDLKAAAGLPSFVVTTFVVSWVWLGAFVFRNIFVGTIVHGNPRSTFECCPSSSDLRIRSTEPLETAIDSCHVNFAIVTNIIKIVELSMSLESLVWLGAGFQKARADSDEALLAGAAEASKAQQAKDAASAL